MKGSMQAAEDNTFLRFWIFVNVEIGHDNIAFIMPKIVFKKGNWNDTFIEPVLTLLSFPKHAGDLEQTNIEIDKFLFCFGMKYGKFRTVHQMIKVSGRHCRIRSALALIYNALNVGCHP